MTVCYNCCCFNGETIVMGNYVTCEWNVNNALSKLRRKNNVPYKQCEALNPMLNLIMNDTAYVSSFLTRMIISIFFSSVDQKFSLGLEGSVGKKQNYNSWILGILSQVGTIGAPGFSCGSIQVSSKTRGGS